MYLNRNWKEHRTLHVIVDKRQLPEVSDFASQRQMKKILLPCVLNENKCHSKCKCLNCENRKDKEEEMSCHCGESSRKKS